MIKEAGNIFEFIKQFSKQVIKKAIILKIRHFRVIINERFRCCI